MNPKAVSSNWLLTAYFPCPINAFQSPKTFITKQKIFSFFWALNFQSSKFPWQVFSIISSLLISSILVRHNLRRLIPSILLLRQLWRRRSRRKTSSTMIIRSLGSWFTVAIRRLFPLGNKANSVVGFMCVIELSRLSCRETRFVFLRWFFIAEENPIRSCMFKFVFENLFYVIKSILSFF